MQEKEKKLGGAELWRRASPGGGSPNSNRGDDMAIKVLSYPILYCSKWQGLYMDIWHDDLDLGSRSLDDLEHAEKWSFTDFWDTIYSISLKPLPSCRKQKDLYMDA